MSQLRLQKRDDPLAIGGPVTENREREARQTTGDEQPPAKARGSASPATRQPRTRRTQRPDTKAPAEAASSHSSSQAPPPQQTPPQQRAYDDDRLEQTGWRIYESLLTEVKARAEELSAAGIPTSAAALAAATLHSYLPRAIEDGAEVMRAYRQATAGRQRARRTA
jgi:hypothetical protein